ncbi:hypothetical protein L6251_02295 [Candidatus Parcubacteria bacterium]|nr:hypothetical protein [Patescibacteria group bacterium]MBU4477270.1 hypothetical protein [Patescibacteria group bacterium]MCG2699229.1 hypothetical protein [Candidatus Parcubacteria bacterium]
MEKKINRFIYWTPRILSIAFILFISMFALDVFDGNNGWKVLLALFMHLIPSFVLIFITIIAWKRDLFGAIVYFAIALAYICLVGLHRHWSWYVSISGPAVLIGILYLASWFKNRVNKI